MRRLLIMPEIVKTDEPPPDAGHEDSDINVCAILKFGAAMFVVAVVIHFAIAWQWSFYNERIRKSDPVVAAAGRQGTCPVSRKP